jgi:hypothetical protein
MAGFVGLPLQAASEMLPQKNRQTPTTLVPLAQRWTILGGTLVSTNKQATACDKKTTYVSRENLAKFLERDGFEGHDSGQGR